MSSSGRRYISVAILYAVVAIIALVPLWTGSSVLSQIVLSDASAQADIPAGPESPEASSKSQGDSILDRYHRELSEDILGIADRLDSFFDSDRTVAEENRTRLRIKLYSLVEKGAKPAFDVRTSFRLSLPKLQKKLNLLISGEPENALNPNNTPTEDRREEFESTDKQNLILSLQYKLKETLRRNISANVGLRFSRITPVFYAEGRYRHQVKLDAWIFRFTQSLKWLTDEGLETRTLIDLERPVSNRFFFRTTADGSWFEHRDGFFYNLNLYVFQSLSSRRVLSYEWINDFQTRPDNRLEEILLQMRYRQKIWRNWIFYEVSPRVTFPRDEGFSSIPGIALKLEAIIGKY
ncbi:hypothetical protein MNBD_NITROSPIRAE02-1337 [hydrothermal vent metagenome]|uniref:DUF3570 domain-containing protein n=1 Tax=hydrothermal vent metagenome TaxID=652676 RepID=A0A3B1CUZ8_9ZZZZ